MGRRACNKRNGLGKKRKNCTELKKKAEKGKVKTDIREEAAREANARRKWEKGGRKRQNRNFQILKKEGEKRSRLPIQSQTKIKTNGRRAMNWTKTGANNGQKGGQEKM